MAHALRIMISLALVALASGCGASETASTSSAPSANAGASAPSGETPHVTSQSTGTSQSTSSTVAPQTSGANPPNPVKATPTQQTTSPQGSAPAARPRTKAAKPKIKAAAPVAAPTRYTFPVEVKRNFMTVCTAENGSTSGCECLIAKYESLDVEEARSIAELLTTEVVLKQHLRLNRRARQFAAECHSAIT